MIPFIGRYQDTKPPNPSHFMPFVRVYPVACLFPTWDPVSYATVEPGTESTCTGSMLWSQVVSMTFQGARHKNKIWVFPKIGVPGYPWIFHYKPSILGYPYFWKHPFVGLSLHHLPDHDCILSCPNNVDRYHPFGAFFGFAFFVSFWSCWALLAAHQRLLPVFLHEWYGFRERVSRIAKL